MDPIKILSCAPHWLTWTVPAFRCRRGEYVLEHYLDAVPGDWGVAQYQGGMGHPSHFVHESGLKLFIGSTVKTMPAVYVAAGAVCEVVGDPAGFVAPDGSVTRLDIALDVEFPDGVTGAENAVRHLYSLVRAGAVTHGWTDNVTFHENISGDEKGVTLQFGSHSSAAQLVLYTKRGFLRIEARIRPKQDHRQKLAGMITRANPYRPLFQRVFDRLEHDAHWVHQIKWEQSAVFDPIPSPRGDCEAAVMTLRAQWGHVLRTLADLGYSIEDFTEGLPPMTRAAFIRNRDLILSAPLECNHHDAGLSLLHRARSAYKHGHRFWSKDDNPQLQGASEVQEVQAVLCQLGEGVSEDISGD